MREDETTVDELLEEDPRARMTLLFKSTDVDLKDRLVNVGLARVLDYDNRAAGRTLTITYRVTSCVWEKPIRAGTEDLSSPEDQLETENPHEAADEFNRIVREHKAKRSSRDEG